MFLRYQLVGVVAVIGGFSGLGSALHFGDSFWSIIITVFYCTGTLIPLGVGIVKTVQTNTNEVRSQGQKLIVAKLVVKENRGLLPTDSQGFDKGETFLRCLDKLGKY